jgi:hypothetical protein
MSPGADVVRSSCGGAVGLGGPCERRAGMCGARPRRGHPRQSGHPRVSGAAMKGAGSLWLMAAINSRHKPRSSVRTHAGCVCSGKTSKRPPLYLSLHIAIHRAHQSGGVGVACAAGCAAHAQRGCPPILSTPSPSNPPLLSIVCCPYSNHNPEVLRPSLGCSRFDGTAQGRASREYLRRPAARERAY